ncbi:myosin phosphatase Rho-interacting protein [Microdochium nivale]|nr:myosin phosphatase Rho-interacting protein [Microdochium nivale]
MAGLHPRTPNPYADERRRPAPQYESYRERDRSRDRSGPVRRDSRDGPARRDSKDLRDDSANKSQGKNDASNSDNSRRISSTIPGGPTSPRAGRHATSRALDQDSRPSNKLPSRLVRGAETLDLQSKPPTVDNAEHQEIISAFWAWGNALLDRGSVKSQLAKSLSESGMRTANKAKLEKADEGTSLALLNRTQQRQYEKDTRLLSTKVAETDKSEHKALQRLITKLVATNASEAPPLNGPAKDDSVTKAVESKFEILQDRFAKQEERLAAQDRAFAGQEQRYEKWQAQMQQLEEQQKATIKTIDMLRAENESLRNQLATQLQDVSEGSAKTSNKVQGELEKIRSDIGRIEVQSQDHYKSVTATSNQNSEKISRTLQDTLTRIEALDAAQSNFKSTQDGMTGQISRFGEICDTMAESIKTCEAEMIDTAQKVDSLDLESLDNMVNTWFDSKIPGRVRDHELVIDNIRNELAVVKDYASKQSLADGMSATTQGFATEAVVDSKVASLKKSLLETVKESTECIADMVDTTNSDVQVLKDGKLPERIAALEAANLNTPSTLTPDPAVVARLQVLEEQKLLEKINSNQAICMARLQELAADVNRVASQPHEPTTQVLRHDIHAIRNQLEGVAMQANNLDTQFKNVSTKEMARLILSEVNQVNSKTDTLGRKAVETTEKLGSRFEDLLSELAKSQRSQEKLQARVEEVSNLVDLFVRSGARTGDKRPAEGAANGSSELKRQRVGSNAPNQARTEPSTTPRMTNGTPRQHN